MERTTLEVVDDIDKTSPAETRRRFSVGGRDYQLDLTNEHAAEFDATLKPWIDSATYMPKPRQRGTPRAEEVRAWALDNGYTLSTHGRIPAHIHKAYRNRNRNPANIYAVGE